MEQLGCMSSRSLILADTSESLGYLRWEEVNVSSDKGRRQVHYYLKRMDGRSDLAIIGKEKSLRRMSYRYAFRNRSVLLSAALPLKLRSRREVIDWLNSIVSDSPPHEPSHIAGSLGHRDASKMGIKTFKAQGVGHLWLGSPWTCRKRRWHYQSFCCNGVKISVHDFVYVLAEEDKRLVAYLEDMYEDSKGNKMVVVRWFHKIDEVGFGLPHNFNDREIFFSLCLQDLSIECIDGLATVLSPRDFEKFLNEAIHTSMDPFVCCKLFEYDYVKPFDITKVKGYWKQELLRYMYSSKDQVKCQRPMDGLKGEDESDAFGIRPRKRLCQSKDDVRISNKSMSTTFVDMHNSWSDCKNGSEVFRPIGGECTALFHTTEANLSYPKHLKIGSEVEVLSQDSGIRGCWFRASIIKKSKDKVKVRYQDIQDAADEANKLEEWVLASRVAVPDPLGIRICGRSVIRPALHSNECRVPWAVDIGTAVDVWWHDAWWEGVVVQKESEDRIHIYFPGEKHKSILGLADLRISQDWVGNSWTHIKRKSDILTCIASCTGTKRVPVPSEERKLAEAAIHDAKQLGKTEAGCSESSLNSGNGMGKELEGIRDLSKDDLLVQLSWKSSKKRRRGVVSPWQKSYYSNNGGKRSSEVLRSKDCERFLVPAAMKIDHENCKCITDSLFTAAVVQSLPSLVMSR